MAEIEKTTAGFSLNGYCDFDNAPSIYLEGKKRILTSVTQCQVDLKCLQDKNTAILAAMMGWKRDAEQQHIRLEFLNISPSLARMIKTFGLTEFLGNG